MDELSKDIGNSKSARVIIPVCHIYLEYMMKLLIEKKDKKAQEFLADRRNGFKKKLEKLNNLDLLSEEEYHDLDLINDIRNDFVHTFKPDLEEISKRILELKFHVFNKKRNPVEVFLYDIIQLMSQLEQKILN